MLFWRFFYKVYLWFFTSFPRRWRTLFRLILFESPPISSSNRKLVRVQIIQQTLFPLWDEDYSKYASEHNEMKWKNKKSTCQNWKTLNTKPVYGGKLSSRDNLSIVYVFQAASCKGRKMWNLKRWLPANP